MRITVVLVMLSMLLLSGCDREINPSRLKNGDELYTYYCEGCHKARGLGPLLENIPVTEQSLKDYEIVLVIKYGYNDNHSMPTFAELSPEQADAIASYIVSVRLK